MDTNDKHARFYPLPQLQLAADKERPHRLTAKLDRLDNSRAHK